MPLTSLANCELRADGFSHEDKVRFLEILQESHGNLVNAAEAFGVSFTTVYDHLRRDEWFNREVVIARKRIAHGPLHDSLYHRALDEKAPAGVTAAIWLQKILGGAEFNPDRAVAPSTVNIAFVQSGLNPTGSGASDALDGTPIIRHSAGLPVVAHRRVLSRAPRQCGCATRGPHKLTCALEGVSKGNVRGSGRLIHGGTLTLPGTPQTAPPQKTPPSPPSLQDANDT